MPVILAPWRERQREQEFETYMRYYPTPSKVKSNLPDDPKKKQYFHFADNEMEEGVK